MLLSAFQSTVLNYWLIFLTIPLCSQGQRVSLPRSQNAWIWWVSSPLSTKWIVNAWCNNAKASRVAFHSDCQCRHEINKAESKYCPKLHLRGRWNSAPKPGKKSQIRAEIGWWKLNNEWQKPKDGAYARTIRTWGKRQWLFWVLGEGASVEGPCLHPSTSVLSIWRQRTDELPLNLITTARLFFAMTPCLLWSLVFQQELPLHLVPETCFIGSADKWDGHPHPFRTLMYLSKAQTLVPVIHFQVCKHLLNG